MAQDNDIDAAKLRRMEQVYCDMMATDADTKETLDYLGKALGVRIELTDTIKNGSKNASLEGDVIRVARDAEGKTINYIARAYTAHEISHRMQEFSPKQWKSFRDYALKQLSEHNADKAEQLISEKIDEYAESGETLTRQQALDEIAAEYAQDLLVDKEMIQKFIASRPKAANNFFQKLKNAIRAAIKTVTGKTAAEKKFLQELTTAQRLWMECFTDAANKANGRAQDSSTQTKTAKHTRYAAKKKAAKNGSSYDYTKSFAQQVNDWIAGRFPKSDALVLGDTPEVLQKIGLDNLPMTINQKHVDYVLNGTKDAGHSLGADVLKQIPAALQNPIAVITSETQANTSIVMLLPLTFHGNQIVAPVYIKGSGKRNGIVIQVNAVTSVFAKRNAISKLLYNAVKNELDGETSIFYWDKEKAIALLRQARVPMPKNAALMPQVRTASAAAANISDGYIHTIHDEGSPVKSKTNNTDTQYSVKKRSTQAEAERSGRTVSGEDAFKEDKYYQRQLDQWEELRDGARIKVGSVQENSALNQVGIPANSLYFDVGKIKKALDKHGDHLSTAVLKQIPRLLSDPVVIAEYSGASNTVNVYGDLRIDNGTPVVIGIVMKLDRSGSNLISNIRTIHARSDFAKQITDDSVLYLNENKKRTRAWFQVCGNLNVPLEGTKFGFIRSITYQNAEVNRYSVNSTREQLDTASQTYGTIEQGENAARDITLPKSVDGQSRVRRFYRTTAESGQTSDRMVTELEREVLNNAAASYIKQSNSAALAKAQRRISETLLAMQCLCRLSLPKTHRLQSLKRLYHALLEMLNFLHFERFYIG